MPTPYSVNAWHTRNWTIRESGVSDVGAHDRLVLSAPATGQVKINDVVCTTPPLPKFHSGDSWRNVVFIGPATGTQVKGRTLGATPTKVKIDSAFNTTRNKHELICTEDTGGPGAGVCWIAEEG